MKHEDVLGKGVEVIPHDAVDFFYRCLLHFRAEQLDVVIRVGESADEYYRKELVAALPSSDAVADMDVDAQDGFGDIAPITGPLDISSSRTWTRCLVSNSASRCRGELQALKVYFDFQKHSFGQRGFIVCPHKDHHHCIMHSYTQDFASRMEFAAALYKWASRAWEYPTRDSHLHHRPTPEWGRPFPESLAIRDF